MTVKESLDRLKDENGFTWMMVANHEGLAICQSGTDEQFELPALLPGWVQNGQDIARAAHLEAGMGLICLVPNEGKYLLLVRGFVANGNDYILMIATPKLPPKTTRAMDDLCGEIGKALA